MLSRLFGKRDKPSDDAGKAGKDDRGQSGKDDGREATWSTWDKMQMPKAPAAPQAPQPAPQRSGPAAQDSTYTGLAPLYTRPVIRTSSMAPLTTTGAMRAAKASGDENQVDFVLPTSPMDLAPELTLEERKTLALDIVGQHHQRIANTIRTLWGYKECSAYINRLIMAGGDGMGHARVGFNQDAVAAMLALSDIHDAEFGPPDSTGGGLSLAP
jgi:hypothetical protein